MKRFISIASISLALSLSMQAQQPIAITLDDARTMAVDNNAKVKMARNNAEAAKEVRREAFTKYFPTISAMGLGFKSNKDVLYYDFDGLFSLGLIRKGLSGNITALQPIFAGGRIVNGNKLAAVGEEAGKLEQEGAADDVRLTAEQYYWQIATLKSKRHTLESVIAMLDTLERQVSAAVNAGVVMPNELLKVQIKRNDMQSLMVDLDNGINLSTQLLAQFIGLDGQEIDVISEPTPANVPAYPHDIYIDPSVALPSTIDYRLLDKKVEAAQLESRMATGANLPTIGIGGGIFYDEILHESHTFAAAFVSVTVPISQWWGGSHNMKKSRLMVENAKTEREDLSQMLKINMTNYWDDLTAAYRKMQIAHESIEQATENLRLNTNYYKAGISTVTELLDAQTLYRQSEDQYTEAYGNFRLCRARYLHAIGAN